MAGGAAGRGWARLRCGPGVPVEDWSPHEQQVFFGPSGASTPGAQNNDGDLLGHVRDVGADSRTERQYKTAAHILPHCDAADAVGLLCVSEGASGGGQSSVVSSVRVYLEMARLHPELVARLFEPVLLDTRRSGGVNYLEVEPLRQYAASCRPSTTPSTSTLRTSTAIRPPPAAPPPSLGAGPLRRPSLEMDFRRWDLQLFSDHVILHSRAAFTDHANGGSPRQLQRLWTSWPRPRR